MSLVWPDRMSSACTTDSMLLHVKKPMETPENNLSTIGSIVMNLLSRHSGSGGGMARPDFVGV